MQRAAALFCAFGLLGLSPAVAAIKVIDSRGQTLELEAPAARIVSLAPHVTELLFHAGAGDRIVAASEYSDYPDEARRIPGIGNASRIDVERLIALAPDLVIAWQSGNSPGDIRRIESLGIRVFTTEPRTLESIGELVAVLGELAGTAARAGPAAQKYADRLAELRARYAGRAPVTVFFQIWEHPFMTVNDRHIISDVLHLCGGRNIFADNEALAPTVSEESVIARDPDVIIATRAAGQTSDPFVRWRKWPQLKAVSRRQLVAIDADVISRHTPRLLAGIGQVCESLDAARH
ncbi:MAG: substrate-binding periplasmic (PBP) ABC transporter protein [Gammaproteobacteria bacterium]|nr:MAG: substrate-binding periplasmic (PBP) ABC transporter protein [Gammaproteobacteria bacterium]TND03628.1 MAG: substrate-binding periplasmic (PBP) ABC transporter protein [Gammaproteobacteria bacterium]